MDIFTNFTVGLPKITSHPESVVVEANDFATFECSAQSYGTASITWKRLESELLITVNVTVTELLNKITSVLRIEKTIGYYEGYYFCVIENTIGQVNSSFAYCDVTGSYVYSVFGCNFNDYPFNILFYSTLSRNDQTTKVCCSTS